MQAPPGEPLLPDVDAVPEEDIPLEVDPLPEPDPLPEEEAVPVPPISTSGFPSPHPGETVSATSRQLSTAAAVGSNLSMFVIMLGAIVGALGLVKLGIILFALMVLFTLVTLPVELDASARAKRLLPALGLTRGHDAHGVSAVLNAAAWTYVAAAVGAVAQLLYLVFATRSLED